MHSKKVLGVDILSASVKRFSSIASSFMVASTVDSTIALVDVDEEKEKRLLLLCARVCVCCKDDDNNDDEE